MELPNASLAVPLKLPVTILVVELYETILIVRKSGAVKKLAEKINGNGGPVVKSAR